MRYILDDNGYIEEFGTHLMTCSNKSCTEYTGDVPEGYETIEEWAVNANIRAYTIVDGQLTYDSAKDTELSTKYENENKKRWSYYLTNKSVTTKTWAAMATELTTAKLPAGKYMILYKASCYGNGNGVATINPALDGERLGITTRMSIPIASALITTTQAIVYKEFESESTHTVNNYIYTNVSTAPQDIYVEFVRID